MFSGLVYTAGMVAVIKKPDVEARLDILAASARFDVCLSSCSGNAAGGVGRLRDPQHPADRWLYPAYVPGRGRVGILKVLQTNVCTNNCSYCAFAAQHGNLRRVSFAPDELARLYMRFYHRRFVHGIFISSGMGLCADVAMERMIRTAEILRSKYRYRGYIHLKLLPGVSYELVEQAARLANRVSVNLEAPSRAHLSAIAPEKDFVRDLLLRMKWAGELVRRSRFAGSQTTQFVLGAADDTDLEVLKAVDWIYRELYVFRAYFSALQPIGDRAELPAADQPLLRENRLYQCDFLLRGYGFRFRDLVFDSHGRLPRHIDPKSAHALMHPELFPVDVNSASEDRLLRVPGIGPISAGRILAARQEASLRSLRDLGRLGAVAKHASPYVEFSGRRDGETRVNAAQPWLFEEMSCSSWRTGLTPYQHEKLPAGGGRYAYPGQTGKRLVYATAHSPKLVLCR